MSDFLFDNIQNVFSSYGVPACVKACKTGFGEILGFIIQKGRNGVKCLLFYISSQNRIIGHLIFCTVIIHFAAAGTAVKPYRDITAHDIIRDSRISELLGGKACACYFLSVFFGKFLSIFSERYYLVGTNISRKIRGNNYFMITERTPCRSRGILCNDISAAGGA